jgi:hypothetical protein
MATSRYPYHRHPGEIRESLLSNVLCAVHGRVRHRVTPFTNVQPTRDTGIPVCLSTRRTGLRRATLEHSLDGRGTVIEGFRIPLANRPSD